MGQLFDRASRTVRAKLNSDSVARENTFVLKSYLLIAKEAESSNWEKHFCHVVR